MSASEIPPRSVAVGAGFDCRKCSICPNDCFREGQVFTYGQISTAFHEEPSKVFVGPFVTLEGQCAYALQDPLKMKVRIWDRHTSVQK